MFTISERLDLLLGHVVGPIIIEDEEGEEAEPQFAGDKRRAAFPAWKQFKEDLRYIFETKRLASKYGLDVEFTKTVRDALGRDEVYDMTYGEARTLAHELVRFRRGMRERERAMEGQAKHEEVHPEVEKAISIIKREAQEALQTEDEERIWAGGERKHPRIIDLLNPRGIENIHAPIKIAYRKEDGAVGEIVIDENDKIIDQAEKLHLAIDSLKQIDDYRSSMEGMKEQLNNLWKANRIVLDYYLDDVSEIQINYTAAFYAIRTITDHILSITSG